MHKGGNNKDTEHIMGRHGVPCEYENGELLFQMFSKHGLLIGGKVFPNRDCPMVTWKFQTKLSIWKIN
jgi:hypothetical protein